MLSPFWRDMLHFVVNPVQRESTMKIAFVLALLGLLGFLLATETARGATLIYVAITALSLGSIFGVVPIPLPWLLAAMAIHFAVRMFKK